MKKQEQMYAVLAMCVTGFGTGRVLVTGGRDAAVKVWK